ncbi:MAG: electron transfer flavoprotein subunit beta/FixA family protein [Gammaproteobacteria bacterium]|nr:electron transfer flavoprotein subunit beta/FixA family protein [Gammaproteobacteria bacterium]
MKILVTVKRAVDYTVRVRPLTDGSGVDIANAKMSMNPFDEIALEQAVQFKEAGLADEIVAVSIGDSGSQDVLRSALAFGADRALLIQTDSVLEPVAVSRILAKIATDEAPHLVLMGKQAIDDDASQTPQMLAARMGWAQGTFACGLSMGEGEVSVIREVDGGTQTLALTLPAVVSVDLRLNEPRYLKLPDIMKAKRKPLEVQTVEELGVDVSTKTRITHFAEPPEREPGVRVQSVSELIDRLVNEAKVL